MDLDDILGKFNNIKKQGSGYTAQCPGHDDKENSLSITEGTDRRILLHCHAGCSVKEILDSMGLKLADLYPEKDRDRKQIAEYLYKDTLGNVIHKTIRYEPKGFTQCRPDKKGGWIYNLKDIQPIIYNLQRVKEAIFKGEIVYIVEGEKDVDNLEKINLAATTSPMGAGKWQDSYSDYLINAITVIIPDNDPIGKSHADQIAKSLLGKAKSIKVIDLTKGSELPPKGDITDFFKTLGKLHGIESLNSIVNDTQEFNLHHEDTWEQPIPFDTFNLPSFPTDCFPGWVAEYIKAVAEDTQTADDMAAVMMLGILSIPCNKVYKVEGKPGWQEPTNVYCTTIAKPGERKSSIMAHITEPICKYEEEEYERSKGDIARNQTERKIIEGELEKLKAQAVKKNDANARAAALDKAEELSQFIDIRKLRLYCDDVSPEKLVGLLSDHNEKMAIVSAEGGIFGMMAGRYTTNVNIDVFLKAHAGDPLKVDRMGRQSEDLKAPALSMALSVQPDILTGIMQNESFRGRGLTARFLFSIPTSKVGARKIECNTIPEPVKNTYSRNLRSLLEVKVPEDPYILKLTHEAFKQSVDFAKELEPRFIDDLENIADWAGKWHGAILRIAGILHVAGYVGQRAWEHQISIDTFNKALLIGRYFLEHAKAAFSLMGADKNIEDCKYVLKWIRKQGQHQLEKRDILRGNRRFKNVEELEPVLKVLNEYGYLKEFEKQREGAVKRFDKFYKVNPLFLFSNSADTRDTRDNREDIGSVSHTSHVSHTDTQIENDYDWVKELEELEI